MKKFFHDFKEFAIKGNVFDLAVGVIIGNAFSKIVTSLVNDIIMPVLSLIIGSIDISDAGIIISNAGAEPLVLKYGAFIKNIIDFLIISFSIFVFIRVVSSFRKKDKKEEAKEEKPSREAELLKEIRDLLKSRT
ncbi:MAG: large-conductance mechanosensitive channel protein MscL [Clostridiaceae bacterium]|nr:large-conductance mechanosensitive channel protein MscL [Clostridiaceae bacterium]